MTTDPFAELGPQLERDRYGRPLVVPADGGKKVAYTRCTTFVSAAEDTFALSQWQQRQVAVGLSKRPDLVSLAASAEGDTATLNDLIQQAHDAAASSAGANAGTALHKMSESLDRGERTLAQIPLENRDDMAAYLNVTAGWTHLHVEPFTVLDQFKIGGTPDRIANVPGYGNVITDLKTQKTMVYGVGKIASQLAVYSRSLLYDIATGQRAPLPDVRTDVGIVIHLPVGKAEATLYEVDLNAGWDGVELCAAIRAWRARKNLAREYVNPLAGMTPVDDDLPDDIDTLRQMWTVSDDATRARIQAKVEEMSA